METITKIVKHRLKS